VLNGGIYLLSCPQLAESSELVHPSSIFRYAQSLSPLQFYFSLLSCCLPAPSVKTPDFLACPASLTAKSYLDPPHPQLKPGGGVADFIPTYFILIRSIQSSLAEDIVNSNNPPKQATHFVSRYFREADPTDSRMDFFQIDARANARNIGVCIILPGCSHDFFLLLRRKSKHGL